MAEAERSSLVTRSNWRVLALAVGLGLVGVALMTFYIRTKDRRRDVISVAVATGQIAGGDTIRRGMMIAKTLPKGLIAGNFVDGSDIISVEGRVVAVDMDPGQPLYWNAIPLVAEGGYDRYLRPENRERALAMTIAGAPVRPGDVIDILGTYAQGNQRQAFEVLPAVTVIDKVGPLLVLSVTPEEQLLLLAAQPCNLTLSIRSKLEPEGDMKLQPVSITQVLPRARELGKARAARLSEPTVAAGSIRRD